MRRALRSLTLAALVACSQAPPTHPSVPERAKPEPRATMPTPSAVPLLAWPVPSESAACVLRGRATERGVAWRLRTRLDAVATMQVEDAFVTAWVEDVPRRHQPRGLVLAENGAMKLRALVASEDLRVVVTEAFVSLPGHIPDGITHRTILGVEGAEAWVNIDIEGATGTISTLPCSSLGFEPNDVGVERLLPPSRGEVVVKRTAQVNTGDGFIPVRSFWTPSGVSEPDGLLAELRRDDRDAAARLVSFDTCGGTVYGFVLEADLLGPPRVRHGSNARCPNTGPGTFVVPSKLDRLMTCARDVPVLLRSATLEDPVGVLKAGATFRVDGGEAGGTTLVTVEAPPARPFDNASFSVSSAALADCTAN
jgi:hypothetical protein